MVEAIREGERLHSYLHPLTTQLKDCVGRVEKVVGEWGVAGEEGERVARVVGGMMGKELWRKQGLVGRVGGRLAGRFLGLEEEEEEEEGGGGMETWALGGPQSFVDVRLGT